ncbi:UPF0146 family protein [Methanoplanus endosymbiosus]|uniref:UPF0146 protein L6E24_10360 n=1 Tax=Methanoplanus endosymbiosus TaxID=33865 RepID=A0A9E7PQS3_9EURY|nr:UPF0146 family protein [Methanoplanus endosymbiosus]UUX91762.1 hypothetical protein L6E24_10360 [Methanoplanus endosymbiosus]
MYVMVCYKDIEAGIADYLSDNYSSAIEIGIGRNPDVAAALKERGVDVSAVDIRKYSDDYGIEFNCDDVYSPDLTLYADKEVIYSVRPGIEMIPSMISIADKVGSDLIVYHLGCEIYMDGGEIIDCGVILRKYC